MHTQVTLCVYTCMCDFMWMHLRMCVLCMTSTHVHIQVPPWACVCMCYKTDKHIYTAGLISVSLPTGFFPSGLLLFLFSSFFHVKGLPVFYNEHEWFYHWHNTTHVLFLKPRLETLVLLQGYLVGGRDASAVDYQGLPQAPGGSRLAPIS